MSNSAVVRRLDLKPTYITDTSDSSGDFFRVTQIPNIFKLGTNTIKINPDPERLQPGTTVELEVLDRRLLALPTQILPGVDGSGRKTVEIEVVGSTPPEEITITIIGDLRRSLLPPGFNPSRSVKWSRTIIADPLEVTIDGSVSGSLLSGSMFIGNGVSNGLQLKGDEEGAFLRSQGYFGFENATSGVGNGFLLYSGSILPNSGDEYGGVGLEMVIDQNNFFKYRTSDNSIDIRTQKFFFGSSSQFISGSDGQIEISSSNFHLNKDGEVVLQGTITAQAGGDIGGWHVGTSVLSSSNNTVRLDPDGPYFISSSGFQVDGAGAITASAGLIGGWEGPTGSALDGFFSRDSNGGVVLDSAQKILRILTGSATTDTIIELGQISTNKYGIIGKKFGTNSTTFKLGEDGNEIAGITFDDGKLNVGSIYHISASTKLDDPIGFISSSQFKVSPSGKITGSEVLLGNKAGGNFLQFAGSTLTVQGTITADNIRTPASIGGSPSTEANASASIKSDGFARFVSASIGGWSVDEGTLTDISGAVKLDSQGPYFISSSGFQIDETGAITASAGNIGGFVIDSDSITSTGIAIRSGDAIELGSATAIGTGQGVFLGNDGTFRAGNPAGQQIKFDGTNIVLSSSAFYLGGGSQFISGSSGNIEISSSNFHLLGGNITASNVSLTGTITATDGKIGDWNINGSSLLSSGFSNVATGAGIRIEGDSNPRIYVQSGSTAEQVSMFFTSDNSWGIIGKSNNNNVFQLGSTNQIAGFTFTTTKIITSGVELANADSNALFISSSAFKVSHTGNVTASNVDLSGKITATEGEIGGLTIGNKSLSVPNIFQISSSNNDEDAVGFISSSQFKVSPVGSVTGSSILIGNKAGGNFLQFQGSTLTVQGSITADNIRTPAQIGGVSSTDTNASSSIKADGFARFVSGTFGGIDFVKGKLFVVRGEDSNVYHISSSLNVEDPVGFISSSKFQVSAGGNVTGSNVLFDGGKIAGWNIDSGKLSNTGVRLSASYGVKAFGTTGENSDFVELFYIDDSNYGIRAASASNSTFKLGKINQIAGWTFDNEKLTGGSMIIRQDGTIESDGFVSDQAGSGFRLTAAEGGFLEVENAKIRGTLSTAVFEKETVNAVGGQLYVANATTLTASADHPGGRHAPTDTTMSVSNVSGFAIGEILSIKKVSPTGFTTEYVKILSASRDDAGSATNFGGLITVERGYSGSTTGVTSSLGDTAGPAQAYTGSQVVVSTGKSGSGYIRLNANPADTTTPFIDIVERTGSDVYAVDLKARLGDLSGISDTIGGTEVSGFGLYTDNAFLKGGIAATFGEIGGFGISATTISSSNNNLILKDNGQITASNIDLSGKISSSVGSIGGFDIQAGQLRAGAGTIKMSAADKQFVLGSGNDIMVLDANVGIHLGSSSFNEAPFNVNMDGELKSTTGNIGGFTIGSTSLSSGTSVKIGNTSDASNLFLSSSNFKVSHAGNITASNVSLTGNITATSGQIGGYTIGNNTISAGPTATQGIVISASSAPKIIVGDMTNTGNRVAMFMTDVNNFGFLAIDDNDDLLFRLGKAGGIANNTIAGWTVSANAIQKSTNVVLDSSNKKISISDSTFGNTGIQLDHNSGTPRFFAGKSNGAFFKFTGTDLAISSSGLTVDTDGFVTATNFSERIVEVTAANSSSYFENMTVSGLGRVRLILDGSGGGDITMNLRLKVVPYNTAVSEHRPIGDVKLPLQAADQSAGSVNLFIDVNGVQFDDGEIAGSGFRDIDRLGG